jgi:mycothiol synthase
VGNLEVRAPNRSEAASIAAALNEHSLALTGRPDVTVDEISRWFDEPGLDVARDMSVAVAGDGTIVGYADLAGGGESGGPVWIDLRVRPDRSEAGPPLVERSERNARQRGAPPHELRAVTHAEDQRSGEALLGAGFSRLRSGYRLEIDADGSIGPPVWPDGLVVRPAAAEDERRAYDGYVDSFIGSPDFAPFPFEQWRFWVFDEDENPAFAFFAEAGEEVAGLSILRMGRGGDAELGWIHVIGVRAAFRRRGIGRALLLHAIAELRARGAGRVGLGVDGDNDAAIRLYESAGMNVVRRNVVYGKQP